MVLARKPHGPTDSCVPDEESIWTEHYVFMGHIVFYIIHHNAFLPTRITWG
jgi:hypothetical protein